MRKSIFEKSFATNRNLIAIIIIGLTILSITLISFLFFDSFGREEKNLAAEKIFNALLPMFATWVGTVLAFYFGRENFEAASNRYKEIITQLSPEVLDDIAVEQIMIDTKTMVAMDIKEVREKSVASLVNFMEHISKSRLPITEGNEIKYIVHKSTFLQEIQKNPNIELSWSDFISNERIHKLITSFLTVAHDSTVESIRLKLKNNPLCKDVFVLDDDKSLLGWLTDTLILQYLKK